MGTHDGIAIIGGGIGGLALALALLHEGLDVVVYEQAPELREVGAGVQISANGTRVLHALGLEQEVARLSFVPALKEIRHWNTGRTWKLFDLGAVSVELYGFPYVMMHRRDLHAILADAIARTRLGALRLGMRCVGLTQSDSGVRIAFDTGESAEAALAVGADGVHSVVRTCLFGADAPQFTGLVAWRGYGETAVKLALLLVAIGLGGSFAVFMLAVTIKITDRMLGLGMFQH